MTLEVSEETKALIERLQAGGPCRSTPSRGSPKVCPTP